MTKWTHKAVYYLTILIFLYTTPVNTQSWQSKRVQMDESGELNYTNDADDISCAV